VLINSLFYLFSALALAGAIAVVSFRSPIYSTLSLLATMFSLAVLFLLQQATFVAVIHVVVYAGAIVILFLFVIMLLGINQKEEVQISLPLQILAGILAFGFVLLVGKFLLDFLREAPRTMQTLVGDVEPLGKLLFTKYLLPFELLSLLLLVAIIGAVYLGKKEYR